MKLPVFTFQFLIGEGVMQLAVRRNLQRLPKRFPIGTTYVVEGHVVEGQGHEGGGHLQVFSRYVVLPSGQRINLGANLGSPAAPRSGRTGSRNQRAARRSNQGSNQGSDRGSNQGSAQGR